MPISVVCPQGHRLNAKESLAGKAVPCPKCGASVAIPAPPVEDYDELAELKLAPLDGGLSRHGPVAAPPTAGLSQRTPAAQGLEPVALAPPDSRTAPLLVAACVAAGGLAAGLLVVAIVGWWLFGQRDNPAPVVAKAAPGVELAAAPANNSNDTPAAVPEPPPPVERPVSSAKSESQPPAEPARAASPASLIQVPTDPRMTGFQLPAISFGLAYDEVSGRLAVANDDHGVLIYDIDDVAAGRLEPFAALPTDGVPAAVGFKALPNRRVFLIAGKRLPLVKVMDADSLEQIGSIRLSGGVAHLKHLVASRSPADRFAYYLCQATAENRSRPANRWGRIDLVAMQEAGQATDEADDIFPTGDGSLLYVRRGHMHAAARWPGSAGDARLKTDFAGPSHIESGCTPDPFGQGVAIGQWIGSRLLSRRNAFAEFEPKAYFRGRPIAVGVLDGNLVLGSANDYRSLATIPLPPEWLPRTNTGYNDFRFRPYLAHSMKPAHLFVEADERREIALAAFGRWLAIVPVGPLHLPEEKWIVVRHRPLETVYVGQEVVVELETEAQDAAFEVLTTEDKSNERTRLGYRLVGTELAQRVQSEPQLELAAAVTARQNVIYVRSVRPMEGYPLPQKIRIDDELITVVGIDDFRDALRVQRTAGAGHSVSAPIVHLKPAEEAVSLDAPLPVIQGGAFRWTPGRDQLGQRAVRLQASSGKVVRQWHWEFDVQPKPAPLPFFATGVEVAVAGDLAVVWGQSFPEPGKLPYHTDPGRKFYLGIYDVEQRELLQHRELPVAIMTATLDASGVYAALNKLPDNARGVVPTEIVKFRLRDLDIETQAAVPSHCRQLQVIAGRYLAARDLYSYTHRLTIPELQPAKPDLPAMRTFPLAGRLRDGCLWDGILWDHELRKPMLLLFPILFGARADEGTNPIPAGEGGQIGVAAWGPFACTWHSLHDSNPFGPGRPLPEFPASLTLVNGTLELHPWTNAPLDRKTATRAAQSVPLVSRRALVNKERFPTALSAAGGAAAVALLGEIHIVPYRPLIPDEQPFRFEEQQSAFVIRPDEPNVVQYHAPGASRYQLQIHAQGFPSFGDKMPVFDAESSDGAFSIELQQDSLLSQASQLVASARTAGLPASERIARHVETVTPVFEALTGRRPNGVPVPVYVTVVAESADGTKRAGLAHSYLVEIPFAAVEASLPTSGRP